MSLWRNTFEFILAVLAGSACIVIFNALAMPRPQDHFMSAVAMWTGGMFTGWGLERYRPVHRALRLRGYRRWLARQKGTMPSSLRQGGSGDEQKTRR